MQQQVIIRNKSDFNVHRLLPAIDNNNNNTLLSKLPTTEKPLASSTLHSALILHLYFKDCSWISANTRALLQQYLIHFGFDKERENLNKQHYYNSFEEDCTSCVQSYTSCVQKLHYQRAKLHERRANKMSYCNTTSARQTLERI